MTGSFTNSLNVAAVTKRGVAAVPGERQAARLKERGQGHGVCWRDPDPCPPRVCLVSAHFPFRLSALKGKGHDSARSFLT